MIKPNGEYRDGNGFLFLVFIIIFCDNDQEGLKDLIAAPALDFFPQNPGWNVEALNQWLLIYRHGKYVKPKDLNTFINSVSAIYELMKR